MTQMRKLRHGVTCLKSHQQLVSDLGFKLKDPRSEVKASCLSPCPAATLWTDLYRLQAGREDSGSPEDPQIEAEPGDWPGQSKRGPATLSVRPAQARGIHYCHRCHSILSLACARSLDPHSQREGQTPQNSPGISF